MNKPTAKCCLADSPGFIKYDVNRSFCIFVYLFTHLFVFEVLSIHLLSFIHITFIPPRSHFRFLSYRHCFYINHPQPSHINTHSITVTSISEAMPSLVSRLFQGRSPLPLSTPEAPDINFIPTQEQKDEYEKIFENLPKKSQKKLKKLQKEHGLTENQLILAALKQFAPQYVGMYKTAMFFGIV